MRVAFVLRSAEVQPMFRRFVWNTLMRSSLQIMYDTDSPPPKSTKGVPPTDRHWSPNQSWNNHHEEPRISHVISKDRHVETRGFSWWFFYHSMFNIQVTFAYSKGATVPGAHSTIMKPSGFMMVFLSPMSNIQVTLIMYPRLEMKFEPPSRARGSLMMRSVALDGGFFIAHV